MKQNSLPAKRPPSLAALLFPQAVPASMRALPSTQHAERHNKGQSFSPAHWPRMRSSSENN
ncbi:hypothetical protein KIF53_15650 [Chromobacterium subtsugae]|uniref:Uncharacterized protein n=1 Tax=Chromobacterium subtsugae TaxID=251747 RepID=A0ABS7FG61_9NEIS|nr:MULTISPECIES: hypothetical protein [Chromobacterium]MBW7567841.1 hypothetical protein [Chromobacterium subtsugae]MBW8289068.1 hypothetical protein [Chromobacterium subtsugae]WSE93787.1 hypothetical protein U6115_11245 [Chromobacterium subtsugae]WVH62164.1 hypothetical protein U6151_11265 [Chromobacterium subtsugae]